MSSARQSKVLVQHVIGAAAAGVDLFRAALPLPVGDNGEADAAVDHVAVVDADILQARRRIERVRMVGDVRLVDHVDHSCRFAVAPLGRRPFVDALHRGAPFAPDVSLKDVVIVGQAERGPIAHDFSERPTELIELTQVVQNRRLGRIANDAEAAVVFVDLVAGEEHQIGIELRDVVRDGLIGKRIVVLAGQRRHPQRTIRRDSP